MKFKIMNDTSASTDGTDITTNGSNVAVHKNAQHHFQKNVAVEVNCMKLTCKTHYFSVVKLN